MAWFASTFGNMTARHVPLGRNGGREPGMTFSNNTVSKHVQEIHIGIAEYSVTKAPHRLTTLGLGSCVGVCLFDRITTVAGLAHIMLPDSTSFKTAVKPAKFADLGVPLLVREMERLGAKASRMEAKLAGGAQMFIGNDKSSVLNIGQRNIDAVKESLRKFSIRITSEDVGGSVGRTITFDSGNGQLSIRSLGQGTKVI